MARYGNSMNDMIHHIILPERAAAPLPADSDDAQWKVCAGTGRLLCVLNQPRIRRPMATILARRFLA